MNSTGLTGMALVVLGLAGFFATAAATALIPAAFGLVFLVLAYRARNPANARSSGAIGAGVAALGVLAGLGNVASRLATGLFPLSAAAFASLALAATCALYLGVWLLDRSGRLPGGTPR